MKSNYVPHDKQKIQGKEKQEMDKRFFKAVKKIMKNIPKIIKEMK